MKQNLTEIICVIDKSGSMASKTQDVIGGFNTFLADQKKESGEALLTVMLFDTEYKMLYNGKDIKEVKEFDEITYMPGGMTALLDAVGKTIDEVGVRLHNTKESERPSKVIFLIITDGQENSSREYQLSQVKDKIKLQQDKYKWDFVFLGANQDAFRTGSSIGIPVAHTSGFDDTPQGVRLAYQGMSSTVSAYRKDKGVDMGSFDKEPKTKCKESTT